MGRCFGGRKKNFFKTVRFSEKSIFITFYLKCYCPSGYEQPHCWQLSWEQSSTAAIRCTPAQEAANKWSFSTSGRLDIWRIHCLCFQEKHDSDTCDQEHLHRNWRRIFASRKSTHFRSNELHWKGGSLSFWREQSFLTTVVTANMELQWQCHAN